MAAQRIEGLTVPFKRRQYHDSYREDLMKRINEKVRKKETHTLTEPEKEAKPRKSGEVIDLMAVWKQSLEKGGKPTARSAPRRATARAPAKRKSARA